MLRFTLKVSGEACKARTSCPQCGKQLSISIPALRPSVKTLAKGAPSDPNTTNPDLSAPTGPALPAWAVRARTDAAEEEDVEDTHATLSVPESLVHWHWANLEYANGSQLASLSNRWWDADDAYDFGGEHSLLPEGYGGLLRKVAVGLDIKLEHVVKKVTRTPQGATVHVSAGRGGAEKVIEADAVIVSLPLGVLKANSVAFDPPLPARKQHAIDRLGFGVLNKVLLGFDVAFWKEREGQRDFWGIAAKTSRQRGQAFQFWNMTRCTGHPLLLVLHAGRAAALPGTDEEAASAAVGATMDALRSIFGHGVVPEPTHQQVTRWEHDPFSLGVYSHVAVGASARDYDMMAEPLWDGNLLWAGEATCREHPATVAGAFLSGVREAGRLACRMYREAQWPAPNPQPASRSPRAAAAARGAQAAPASAPALAPQIERRATSIPAPAAAQAPAPTPMAPTPPPAPPPVVPVPAAPAPLLPLPIVHPGIPGAATHPNAAAAASIDIYFS
jgi:lysine-specific histone demethylase 1